MAFYKARRGRQMQDDFSRGRAMNALVRDFAGQDSDITTFLDHLRGRLFSASVAVTFGFFCKN